MRYLIGMILLPTMVLAFLGCATVDPPSRAPAPVAVEPLEEPSEPNDAGGLRSQISNLKSQSVAAEAVAPPAQVNEPPGQIAESPNPNDVPVPEPNGAAESPDPNDAPAEAPAPVAVAPREEPSEPNDAGGLRSQISNLKPQSPYAEILATYVREDGLVDYGELRRRRLDLKPILTTLDELDPNVYHGWPRQEKLAFWINAYNLKMLDIIARNYPIESSWWLRLTWSPSDIRHIEGIWTDYRFIVMEEEFTLAEVEQRFFRKTFDDPRVYLALTYASQSGPPLRTRPYGGAGSGGLRSQISNLKSQSPEAGEVPTASGLQPPASPSRATDHGLDRQLDEQVKRFLASPQGLQIDRRNRVVRLSALFKPNWRGREFVARYGTDRKFKTHDPATRAVLSFLTNYLSREDVEFLEVENYSLEYLNFDWRLNDTSRGY